MFSVIRRDVIWKERASKRGAGYEERGDPKGRRRNKTCQVVPTEMNIPHRAGWGGAEWGGAEWGGGEPKSTQQQRGGQKRAAFAR